MVPQQKGLRDLEDVSVSQANISVMFKTAECRQYFDGKTAGKRRVDYECEDLGARL